MATMNSGMGGPAGYGSNLFSSAAKAQGGNDDGAVEVDVSSVFPAGITLFGSTYASIFINSNGAVTFSGANSSYNFAGADDFNSPALLPFYSDIDITSGGEIYWDVNSVAGTVTITWDGVAPYGGSGANSFQVVLSDAGSGEIGVEYIYGDIQWGSASGTPAVAGLTDGSAADYLLEFSGDGSAMLGYENNDFDNADPAGTWSFQTVNGIPDVLEVTGTSGGDAMGVGYVSADGLQITDEAERIGGGAGNDTITAGLGDDTVLGGSGDDVIVSGSDATGWTSVTNGSTINGDGDQNFFSWTAGSGDSALVRLNNSAASGEGDGVADFVRIETTNQTGVLTIGDFDTSIDKIVLQEAYVSSTVNDFGSYFEVRISYANGNSQFFDIYTDDGVFDPATVFTTTVPTPMGMDDDSLLGEDGADTFQILDGPGNDTLIGGEGGTDFDVVDLSAVTSGVTIAYTSAEAGTITVGSDTLSFSEIEEIRSGEGDDVVDASLQTSNVTLDGGDGNDTITGGVGRQTISGGDGDDEIFSGNGAASVDGGAGDDTIHANFYQAGTVNNYIGGADTDTLVIEGSPVQNNSYNINLTTGIDNYANTYSGFETIIAGAGNDTLTGDTLANRLEGGDNQDRFVLLDDFGADTLDGGSGGTDNDRIIASSLNAGVTVLYATDQSGSLASGDDTLTFSEIEYIEIGDYADSIDFSGISAAFLYDGLGGNDTLLAGSGNDTLLGGAGDDSLSGGDGADLLKTGQGQDTLIGGAGQDTLMNAAGDDSLVGGTGADLIIATQGSDTLEGGAGDDTLMGGTGADSLDGGADADLLLGDLAGVAFNETGTDGLALIANLSGFPQTALSYEITFSATDLSNGSILGSYAVSGTDNEFLVQVFSTGQLSVILDNTNVNTGVDISGLFDGDVHTLAITWNGDGGAFEVYADGSSIYSGTHVDGASLTQGGTFVLGQEQDSVGGNFDANQIFKGTIHGVRLYDDVRDSAEVLDSALGPVADNTDPDIVANWVAQEGSAQFIDYQGGPNMVMSGDVAASWSSGADTIIGGDGVDTLFGGGGHDSILAGTGASDDADDTIYGGDGDDTIVSGDGGATSDDFIDGGAGNDLITSTGSLDVILGGDGNDTIDAGRSDDSVSGGAGDDLITEAGSAWGSDTLDGGSGSDTISAGVGDDSVTGGDDGDTFVIEDSFGADTIAGGEGGVDSDLLSFSTMTGAISVTFSGNESGSATDGSDTLGFSQVERFELTDQADDLDASATSVGISVESRDGSDTITGGSGDDTVFYGDGDNVISAGAGNDYLDDEAGNPGYTGENTIDLGDGNDTIYSGYGNDSVLGGDGADVINVQWGDDTVDGGDGADNILSEEGDADLRGGAGNDTIQGGIGRDTIRGGTGDDNLSGGSEADAFVIEDGFGADTITGGEGGSDTDSIDLSALSSPVSVNFSSDEAGTITDGSDTLSFTEIETFILTSGADLFQSDTGTAAVSVSAGGGNDSIEIDGGADTVDAGSGDDSISVDAVTATVSLEGGIGTDTIDFDGEFADIVKVIFTVSGDGSYAWSGGGGGSFTNVEVFQLGSLADTVDGSAAAVGLDVQGSGGNDSLVGGSGNDALSGGDDADTLVDGAGNDTLIGGDGDDSITLGIGNDSVEGGEGNDFVDYVGATGTFGIDTIDGGGGTDTIDFDNWWSGDVGLTGTITDAGFSITDGTDTVTGSGVEAFQLTYGGDTIDASANTTGIFLSTRDGSYNGVNDDVILGGSGDDTIATADGHQTITAGAGNDSITSINGARLLRFADGFGDDTLDASTGSDTLDFSLLSAQSVSVTMTSGSDGTALSATDSVLLDGNFGAVFDAFVLSGNADSLDASASADGFRVTAGAGSDTITGSKAGDVIDGDAGDDVLEGGDGFDIVSGGAGADTIALGGDNGAAFTRVGNGDTVTGSNAADVFVWEATTGASGQITLDDGSGTSNDADGQVDYVQVLGDANTGTLVIHGFDAGQDVIYLADGTAEVIEDAAAAQGAGVATFTVTYENGNVQTFEVHHNSGGSLSKYAPFWTGTVPTLGADIADGGDDADVFTVADQFDADTIIGGEGGLDDDEIDLSAVTTGVTVTVSGAELGTVSDGVDTLSFSEVERLTLTGDGDRVDATGQSGVVGVHIAAGGGADTLDGGNNADTLDAGAGDDGVVGGSGDDSISGGTGADKLAGGAGSDTIRGGDDGDRIIGGGSGDSLFGDAGADTILGDAGADTIDGGAGADRIEGGAGNDVITYAVGGDTADGGEGDDTLRGGFSAGVDDAVLSGGAGDDSLVTYGANDTLFGGEGNDVFNADSGDEYIDGGADADTIYAKAGADTILGGTGDDEIWGDAGADRIVMADGFGNDTVIGGDDFDILDLTGVTTGVTIDWTGTGAGTVISGADTITFSEIEQILLTDANDALDASAETVGINVVGSGGQDTIRDGSGDDTITGGGSGRNDIYLSGGNDSVDATTAGENVYLSDGFDSDTITGDMDDYVGADGLSQAVSLSFTNATTAVISQGANSATATDTDSFGGTAFDDTADFSAAGYGITYANWDGDDTVTGSAFADSFTSHGDAGMILDMGGGNDSLSGQDGFDSVSGGSGADTVATAGGDDIVFGDAGDDVLSGGAGADSLYGGTGADSLEGSDDEDSFFVEDGFGNDTVDGGDGGTDLDTIDLSALSGGVTATYANGGAGTITDGSDTITFSEIEFLDLTAFADVFTATNTTHDVTVEGGGRSDTLSGARGDHTLRGGLGDDALYAGNGQSSLDGGAGNDTLYADFYSLSAKPNSYDGGADTDVLMIRGTDVDGVDYTIDLAAGTDTYNNTYSNIEGIEAGSGDDVLSGGSGGETLSGGLGDDSISGGGGGDVLKTGLGQDTLDGGDGDDTLLDAAGDGSLAGGRGADSLVAAQGSDTLAGGTGRDTLMGGTEADSLDGGGDDDLLLGDLAGVLFNDETNAATNDGAAAASALSDFPQTQLSYELTFSSTQSLVSQSATLASYAVGGADNEFLVYAEVGGELIFALGDGAPIGTGVDVSGLFNGTVQTLGVTWDSASGAVEIYANGSGIYSGTHATGDTLQQGGTFVLGQEQDFEGGGYSLGSDFAGTIYGARLYKDIRTPTEITDTVHAPVADTSDPNLIANWVAAPGSASFTDQTGNYAMAMSGDVAATWSSGDDTLTGGAGSDTLYGGGGNDTLSGGEDGGTLDPVVLLDFEDGASATASDQGSNGLDGVYQGNAGAAGTGWTGGGTAVDLDGVGDYVEIPDNPAFQLAQGTISIRVNTDDIAASGDDAIFSRDSQSFDGGGHVNASVRGDGSVSVRLQSASDSHELTSAAGLITDGTWHHIAVTFGSEGLTLYVDGVVADTDPYSGGIDGNNEPWTLGASQQVSGDGVADALKDFFDGQLDEFALYDTQLTGAQIAELNTGGATAVTALDGDDRLEGGGGSDVFVIAGEFGDDTVIGGEDGADTDRIDLGAVSEGVSITYTLGESGTATIGTNTLTFSEVEEIGLTEFADAVDASAIGVAVSYDGLDGNDTLVGSSSGDTIAGGAGDDYIEGGAGADLLMTGSGQDTLIGGEGDDTLLNSAGDDSLVGGAGADSIVASAGDDTLEGGAGADTLIGGGDDDQILGGADNDSIRGDDDITFEVPVLRMGVDFTINSGTFEGGANDITLSVSGSSVATFLDDDGSISGDSPNETFTVAGQEVVIGGVAYQVLQDDSAQFSNDATGDIYTFAILDVDLDGSGQANEAGEDGTFLIQIGGPAIPFGANLSSVNGTTNGSPADFDLSSYAAGGADSIDAGSGDDTVSGEFGDDTIAGGTGDDSLSGGDDADTFLVADGFGNDTIIGGEGGNDDDVIDLSAVTTGLVVTYSSDEAGTITVGADTITFSEIERIITSDAADSIDARSTSGGIDLQTRDGADTVLTGDGNDSVDLGAGADSVDGSLGADTLVGGSGDDQVNYYVSNEAVMIDLTDASPEVGGYAHGDTLSGFEEIDASNAYGDTIVADDSGMRIFGHGGDDSLTGGAGTDSLAGGEGADTLSGGAGVDTLEGAGGDDSIDGGADGDRISGDAGNDTLGGGTGNDTIYGGDDDDVIDAGDGNDSAFGGSGTDSLVGGEGNDDLQGQSGNDTLEGGIGNDSLDGGADNDSVLGGTGQDILLGDAGNDTLDGGADADTLSSGSGADNVAGGDGADLIFGNSDNDTITGDAGDDTISGGGGDDEITGGDGDDVFTYSVGDGADTITDFNTGNSGALGDGDISNNDFINLSSFYDDLTELRADFADDGLLNQSNATNTGGDAVDYADNSEMGVGDSLLFSGASQSSFTADNTGVVCFTPGIRIDTDRGPVPVELLRVGDLVQTADNGLQPIVWIGRRCLGPPDLDCAPALKPVLIQPGEMLGNAVPLLVSQQHRFVLRGDHLGDLRQSEDSFVRAKFLPGLRKSRTRVAWGCRAVTYIHVMTERHEVIFAEGAATETFWPGPQALDALDPEERATLAELFPECRGFSETGVFTALRAYGDAARPDVDPEFLPRPRVPQWL